MIGKRQVYPVLSPFPVWRYGALYDFLDGHYIGEGWWPDRYLIREVGKDYSTAKES